MYFSSLAVFTTLACATFSVAAPLTPVVNGLDLVSRDVPSTVVSPLVTALTSLSTDLEQALAALVQVVDGKIKVEVDTNELKDALTNVVAVVTSHVEDIKDAAVLSVGNIETLVVGEILVDIITNVYTALDTVAGVKALALEVLDPVVAQITTQLTEVVGTVESTVPSAINFVIAQVKPLYTQITNLSIAVIFSTLGVESPVA